MTSSVCRIVVMTVLLIASAHAGAADRPTAMSLFPGETVLFIRAADARLLVERFQQTSLVQMVRDPGLADFVGSIKESAQEAYDKSARDDLDVELDALLRLPQGEIAFGVVERPGSDPAVLMVVDFGEEVETVENLLEQAKIKTAEDGGAVGEEQIREDKVVTLRGKNSKDNTLGVVQREGVFVACNDSAILTSVLDRWDGIKPQDPEPPAEGEKAEEPRYTTSLEKNRAFASSLRECLKGRQEPPQAIAFVDPIGFVRAAGGRETGVRVALATLPALGVTSVEGAAAALWVANDTWDHLFRGHLLIDNPRTGVVRIARLGAGDRTPPNCVPADAVSYATLHVDPMQIHDDIQTVVDRFTFEGNFATLVKNSVSDEMGLDLPTEVLPVLTGRVSMIEAFEPEATSVIKQTFGLFEVNDADKAKELLKRFMEKEDRGLTEQSYGDVEYYGTILRDQSDDDAPERRRRRGPRFTPVIGILDNAVIVGSSTPVFKALVDTAEGTTPRLRDAIQFKLVSSRVRRLAAGKEVGALSYENPGAALRHWHAMASDAEATDRLGDARFPFAKTLRDALQAGELPPVEDLVKYATPRGAVIYDTPTGFHYINFAFKRSGE